MNKKLDIVSIDSILCHAYQEGHENDAIAREAAIRYMNEELGFNYAFAASIHDERIHKCGLIETMRLCGEPSWIINTDKCPNVKKHDHLKGGI